MLDVGLSHGQLSVTWTDPADLDFSKVRVYVKDPASSAYGAGAEVDKGVQSYSISGLTDTTYIVKVTTVDLSGNESSGSIVGLGTDNLPPAEVGNVVLTPQEEAIDISWTDPGDTDFLKTRIYVKKAIEVNYSPDAAEVEKGIQQYALSGLNSGNYKTKVSAVDLSGNETAGIEKAFSIPAEVSNLIGLPRGDSILLQWDEAAGAGFRAVQVYVKESGASDYNAPVEVTPGTKNYTISALTRTASIT
jgi:hypothetical protein